MFTVGAVLLVLGAIGYVALLWCVRRGLLSVLASPPRAAASPDLPWVEGMPPMVSVIVPARDEEAHIETCVESILANDFPEGAFEVIVVDDCSDDDTPYLVRQLQHAHNRVLVSADGGLEDAKRLHLLHMWNVPPFTGGHKHHAIERAIQAAQGRIILTTDADCTVPSGWIRSMVAPFEDDDTAFVAGPVRFRYGRALFERIQALEFMGLIAFGAGTQGMGTPTICNSANLAYRRDTYLDLRETHAAEIDGAASDELMLQHIAYDTNWSVYFNGDLNATVDTDPEPGILDFLRQRQRWASMATRYPRRGLVIANCLFYAFHVLLLSAFVAAFWVPALWPFVLGAFGAKVLADWLLLKPATEQYDCTDLLPTLPLTEVLQVPYIVYIGAAGALGTVEWKGRAID